jgi:hypothetical protein
VVGKGDSDHLPGYLDQLQPALEHEDTKLLKIVKESSLLNSYIRFVLNRFTNHYFLSGTLIYIGLLFQVPPLPLIDPVAQRAEGVKQGKLHAASAAISLALKLFLYTVFIITNFSAEIFVIPLANKIFQ